MEKSLVSGLVAGITAAVVALIIYFWVMDHRADLARDRTETAAFHKTMRDAQRLIDEQASYELTNRQ